MIRNIRLNTKTKQIIQSVYPTMSSLQQSIADYFLENTELLDFSSKRISKILYVSEPTLSRFAQKCNFKGYREFIYEYSNDLQNCEVDSSDENQYIKENIQTQYFESLKNKCIEIADQDFDHLQEILDQSGKIYIYGEGFAATIANTFQYRLINLGYDISIIPNVDFLQLRSHLIQHNDLFIYISMQDEPTIDSVSFTHLLTHEPYAIYIGQPNAKLDKKPTFTEFYQIPNAKDTVCSPLIPFIVFIDLLANYIQFKSQK